MYHDANTIVTRLTHSQVRKRAGVRGGGAVDGGRAPPLVGSGKTKLPPARLTLVLVRVYSGVKYPHG